jgi:hypothetical protein
MSEQPPCVVVICGLPYAIAAVLIPAAALVTFAGSVCAWFFLSGLRVCSDAIDDLALVPWSMYDSVYYADKLSQEVIFSAYTPILPLWSKPLLDRDGQRTHNRPLSTSLMDADTLCMFLTTSTIPLFLSDSRAVSTYPLSRTHSTAARLIPASPTTSLFDDCSLTLLLSDAAPVEPSAPPAIPENPSQTGEDETCDVERLNINEILDAVYASCTIHIDEATRTGVISVDDVESLEPFIFIGVPSVVLFNAIRVRNPCLFERRGVVREGSFDGWTTPIP